MRIHCLFLFICLALSGVAADVPAPTMQLPPELTQAADLEHKGELKEAERILLAFIDSAERTGAKAELSVAMNNLAVLYGAMERPADSERYFKRAIRTLESIEGPGAKHALARTRLHLAAMYIESERPRQAEKLNFSAFLQDLQSPEDQARARGMLASLAMVRKKFPEAETMLLGVLSFWQSHATQFRAEAEIATTLNNLGIIAWQMGRMETALSRLNQSLTVWRGLLGPDHPTLAKAMGNIATVYVSSRQYDDAAKWLEQAIAIGQRTFGDVHPFTVGLQTHYARVLKKAGRKSEATEMARTAAEARKSLRSPSIADYTVDYRDSLK
jgi:tetratricopeptide (TPR) repeat protein